MLFQMKGAPENFANNLITVCNIHWTNRTESKTPLLETSQSLTIQHLIPWSSTRGRMRHLMVDELPELLQHVRISKFINFI